MEEETQRQLRALPAVHEVLERLKAEAEFSPFLTNKRNSPRLKHCVRQVLQNARKNVYQNSWELGGTLSSGFGRG